MIETMEEEASSNVNPNYSEDLKYDLERVESKDDILKSDIKNLRERSEDLQNDINKEEKKQEQYR
ncbi:hypothetical protein D3C76_1370020 [compost metagenome]